MSIDIRYLTNGKKSVYVVRNSGVSPVTVEYFYTKDDIPKSIRHYAPDGEPLFAEPDTARMFKALDILYPGFPKCGHEKYLGRNCIAETCTYAPDGDWTKCPYFPGYEVKE